MKVTPRQVTAAVIKRLREARDIEIIQREGWAALAPAERDTLARQLKRHLGQPLAPTMLQRLSYPVNARLYWRYPHGDVDLPRDEGFAGEVCLYNLAESLTKKDFSHIDYKKSPDLKFLEEYRILDEHPNLGDGQMTLVRLNDAATDVELFHLSGWKLYRLRLTFEEYHWCQAVTLGYANWQLMFCDGLRPRVREDMQTTFRERLASDLNKVWPGTDLGELFALADRAV